MAALSRDCKPRIYYVMFQMFEAQHLEIFNEDIFDPWNVDLFFRQSKGIKGG